MENQAAVLVVDDDEIGRRLIREMLASAGYRLTTAGSGEQALELLGQIAFDVVLTDIWMGEVSGIDVLHAARRRPEPPEVIMMTGKSSVDTAVKALRAGAFNYLSKPCERGELLETVAAAVRRRRDDLRKAAILRKIAADLASVMGDPEPPPAPDARARFLEIGRLSLDRHRHTASFGDEPLHLTPTEFTLLTCLAEAADRVVSWGEIAERTHGARLPPDAAHDLLRVHIRNLRRKFDPRYIVTVRGVGFMLTDPDAAGEPAS